MCEAEREESEREEWGREEWAWVGSDWPLKLRDGERVPSANDAKGEGEKDGEGEEEDGRRKEEEEGM